MGVEVQKRLIDSSPPKVMQDPKPKVYRRYQGKCSRQKEHCICSKLHMQRWGDYRAVGESGRSWSGLEHRVMMVGSGNRTVGLRQDQCQGGSLSPDTSLKATQIQRWKSSASPALLYSGSDSRCPGRWRRLTQLLL